MVSFSLSPDVTDAGLEPERGCARAAECACPHPPSHHCHSTQGGHGPASKTCPWDVTHQGLGTALHWCQGFTEELPRRSSSEGEKKKCSHRQNLCLQTQKVMRSTAGGSTGRKDLSASFALLFNASSFIINCYLLQMLKLVKRLI